jgi:hypothetical protein
MKYVIEILFILFLAGLHIVEIAKLRKMSKRIDHICTPVKLNNQWRPRNGETFFYLGSAGTICHQEWTSSEIDEQIRAFMGIYATEGEAITAREHIIRELQQLHEGIQ